MGDFNKKFIFKDLVKGTIELPENDIDQVLVKSDGIPPYAFAHVCDDHFMRVTTVTRDDSYISSVPYHLELWNACGFKAPKFAHLLPLNKKEGEIIRKIMYWTAVWCDNQGELYHLITSLIQHRACVLGREVIKR